MTRRAIIVGAGVGGLATAAGLHADGWQVRVLERWPRVVGIGAALGVWPDAQRALAAIGVDQSFRVASVAPGPMGVYTSRGRPLLRMSPDSPRAPQVRLISRQRLMDLLVGATEGVDVATGVRVDDAGLRTAAKDADVVIGADGVRSVVRTAFFGDRTRPRDSGMIAWRGSVGFEAPDQGESWGEGALFGMTPMEPGRTNFYAAVPIEDEVGSLADLRVRFAQWRTPIPEVLARAETDDVLHNPIEDLHPALRRYACGRVVLIGDAAHAMTPNVGRGACEALLDAECLVTALRSDDVDEALRRYDAERRRPSQRTAARSWRMMRVVRSQRFAPLRNGIVGLAGRFVS